MTSNMSALSALPGSTGTARTIVRTFSPRTYCKMSGSFNWAVIIAKIPAFSSVSGKTELFAPSPLS